MTEQNIIHLKESVVNSEYPNMLWSIVSVSHDLFDNLVQDWNISLIKAKILQDPVFSQLLDEASVVVTLEDQTSIMHHNILSKYIESHQQELAENLSGQKLIVVKVSLQDPKEVEQTHSVGLKVTKGGE